MSKYRKYFKTAFRICILASFLGLHIPAIAQGQQSYLNLGQTLNPGEKLIWGTGTRSRLVMRADGNLIIESRRAFDFDWRLAWHTNTSGHPGATLTLKNDGNLVLRDSHTIWESGTAGKGVVKAILFFDQIQLITNDNKIIWCGNCCLNCVNAVEASTLSNGCGGKANKPWKDNLQNLLADTIIFVTYKGVYTVDVRRACDMHDAGYEGAVVNDHITQPGINVVRDYSGMSRKDVDDLFLSDIRALCDQTLPTKVLARGYCKNLGPPRGARSYYDLVRHLGHDYFDDKKGKRANDPNW